MNRRGAGRIAAYLAVVVVGAGGLWRVETTARRASDLAEKVEREDELGDARQCVNAWEGRRGVRSLIDGLVAASSSADPARVQAFREDMARRLPDPECDLDAAEATVADAGG